MLTYSSCTHNSFYMLGKVKKCSIFIGAPADLEDYVVQGGRPKLIVDLTGSRIGFEATRMEMTYSKPSANLIPSLMQYEELLESAKLNFDRLTIDWTDKGIPTMDRTFWDKFVDILKKIDGSVFIHCIGGHGRTGCVAAILVGLLEIDTDGIDPITYIRKQYCDKAVESDVQILYVEVITELDCDAARKDIPEPTSNWGSALNQWNSNAPIIIPSSTYGKEISNVVATEKWNPNHYAALEIDRDMYDDLNWDAQAGYLDSMGTPIGETLFVAVSILKARKVKKAIT